MSQPLPVYVVHSRALVERRAALERALASLGWTATWIETPEADAVSYVARRISLRLSRAQASVYLKHLETWQRIAGGTAPRALVLEDDPVFPPGFARVFEEYLAALPADAQSAFFGASCGHEAPPMPGNRRFAAVDRTRSMSVYVVTREWARELYQALARAPMTQPIDLAVDTVIRARSLPAYWSVPALVDNGSETGRFPRAITKGPWRSHAAVTALRTLPPSGLATFAIAGLLLAPVLAVRGARMARRAAEAVVALRTDDREQWRLQTYGDCAPRGYGYLRRVLRAFPEPDAMPRIHYGETERYVALLVPEVRPRLEPRVLVGVGVDWDDTRERLLAATPDPAHAGAWTFRSVVDLDLLAGVQVVLADTAAGPRTLGVTVYETPNRVRILVRRALTLPAGAREGVVRLEPPLERFADRRSQVDFVVEITGAANVSAVNLAVVPMDGRGLAVVHQEGSCLTAVSADVLREAESGSGPWANWLTDVRRTR